MGLHWRKREVRAYLFWRKGLTFFYLIVLELFAQGVLSAGSKGLPL